MGLFDDVAAPGPAVQSPAPGLTLLQGFALAQEAPLRRDLEAVVRQAPFRHMVTRGGYRMSVAMTNCGDLGWMSDRRGYRYAATDPDSAQPWPAMPGSFRNLAAGAAALAGFGAFAPDACLVNRYEPGARMTLHQDRNERDFSQPIVSVSLGVPATFLFGGAERAVKPLRLRLVHGDVVVWGGEVRLNFHGVAPLRQDLHPVFGAQRINLTFRKAAG
jgi:alkylated DNA repair protein (DNA oxidative demethylase)